MDKEIKDALFKDLDLAACSVRGNILQRCTELEMAIEGYIVDHFCKDDFDKSNEFISLIIAPRVIFENKVQILKVLLEKYNPDFVKNIQEFINVLLDIVVHRNNFAHFPLDITDEALEDYRKSKIIRLIKFKNSKNDKTKKTVLHNILIYPQEYINQLIDSIYDCRTKMYELADYRDSSLP